MKAYNIKKKKFEEHKHLCSNQEFRKWIRIYRLENDCMYLKDMAKILGVKPSYLSGIENGKRAIPRSWLEIIPERLSLNEVLTEEIIGIILNSDYPEIRDYGIDELEDLRMLREILQQFDKMTPEKHKVIMDVLINEKNVSENGTEMQEIDTNLNESEKKAIHQGRNKKLIRTTLRFHKRRTI